MIELSLEQINMVSGGNDDGGSTTVTTVEGCGTAYPDHGTLKGYGNGDNTNYKTCVAEVKALGEHVVD